MLFGGATWSMQIIGLLSAWKQEGQAREKDKFQDFMVWLQNHNFNTICQRIYESEEVSRELNALLSQSLTQIDDKLERIALAVAGIASKIEGLQELDRAASDDTETLSTQAREILKLFADSEGTTAIVLTEATMNHTLYFLPSNNGVTMDEARFVPDDVETLALHGLIIPSGYTKGGNPKYSLTRAGSKLADTLPPVEIRDERQ